VLTFRSPNDFPAAKRCSHPWRPRTQNCLVSSAQAALMQLAKGFCCSRVRILSLSLLAFAAHKYVFYRFHCLLLPFNPYMYHRFIIHSNHYDYKTDCSALAHALETPLNGCKRTYAVAADGAALLLPYNPLLSSFCHS
jgi:hypothetical protein